MSYHIVSIDQPEVDLTYRDGKLVCESPSGQRRLPLEDVSSIVITSYSARIHTSLIQAVTNQGVALVICEKFKPLSLVLPACRSTDTLLTRKHLALSEKLRQRLWEKTIDAKCENQLQIARRIDAQHPYVPKLERAAHARSARKEGGCAKIYWDLFSASLQVEGFNRGRSLGGLNDLLNYGYAVLLSNVLQKLYGYGLDPIIGISHAIRERSTPLAYDLMEPFRPCVDWRIYEWVRQLGAWDTLEVTTDFRRWVTRYALDRVDYFGLELDINGCIEGVARSFRQAILAESPKRYRPWTLTNSKWAG